MRDYTPEAEALFARIAGRHDLRYEVEGAPVEVMWRFPFQDGLSLPIVLALQNNDELNFGVGDFWSYFFPFEDVAVDFEAAVDAWIAGEARVAPLSRFTYALQLHRDDTWETVYRVCGLFPKIKPWPTLQNAPSHQVET